MKLFTAPPAETPPAATINRLAASLAELEALIPNLKPRAVVAAERDVNEARNHRETVSDQMTALPADAPPEARAVLEQKLTALDKMIGDRRVELRALREPFRQSVDLALAPVFASVEGSLGEVLAILTAVERILRVYGGFITNQGLTVDTLPMPSRDWRYIAQLRAELQALGVR